ncbi:MAG: hypothetical protein HXY40_17475 [Chloroflexi bacterium]|nr:hypothetical protein [Chloroflexota bacterium]
MSGSYATFLDYLELRRRIERRLKSVWPLALARRVRQDEPDLRAALENAEQARRAWIFALRA